MYTGDICTLDICTQDICTLEVQGHAGPPRLAPNFQSTSAKTALKHEIVLLNYGTKHIFDQH